jgi:predicted nucleotidyltransferase
MSFGLSESTIEKIQQLLAQHANVEQAVIYGSRAKGNYRPGSDIDLCLQGATLSTTELSQLMNELDDLLLPYTIDLSLHHQLKEPALLDHIARVGKVFYGRTDA